MCVLSFIHVLAFCMFSHTVDIGNRQNILAGATQWEFSTVDFTANPQQNLLVACGFFCRFTMDFIPGILVTVVKSAVEVHDKSATESVF